MQSINRLSVIRLALLRLETSSLFDVMSKTFPDAKSRLIFLINTYDLVLMLLSVSRFDVAANRVNSTWVIDIIVVYLGCSHTWRRC